MMEGVATKEMLYGFEGRETDKRRVVEHKAPEIKQLWQRSHEIVLLAAKGYKYVEIAEILGITPQTVTNLLNSELGQKKLSEIRLGRDDEAKKDVERVNSLKRKALAVYHEIFDNELGEATLKDRKEAAKDVVMELSGLREPLRVQSSHINLTLTSEEIEQLKRRGIEAARESGMIIDVEPEQITEGETE